MSQQRLKTEAGVELEASPPASTVGQPGKRGGLQIMDRVRLFLLRRRIDAMLRDTVGPVRHADARNLPSYLLRDIGLQPPF
jgi:hypothetical protein